MVVQWGIYKGRYTPILLEMGGYDEDHVLICELQDSSKATKNRLKVLREVES